MRPAPAPVSRSDARSDFTSWSSLLRDDEGAKPYTGNTAMDCLQQQSATLAVLPARPGALPAALTLLLAKSRGGRPDSVSRCNLPSIWRGAAELRLLCTGAAPAAEPMEDLVAGRFGGRGRGEQGAADELRGVGPPWESHLKGSDLALEVTCMTTPDQLVAVKETRLHA